MPETQSMYLIGAPGSGKSTVMVELVRALGLSFGEPVSLCRETTVQWLQHPQGHSPAWTWGKQRGPFSGTDALGMAASRYLREWIEAEGESQMPCLVLGEGVRLANIRFLLALDTVRPTTIVHLTAPENVLQERCTARNGDFAATYKAGVATRAAKLSGELEMLGFPVIRINTEDRSPREIGEFLATKITVL